MVVRHSIHVHQKLKKHIKMSAHYEVFICHRGTETKRNLVSVLNGMLRLKGITSFVDYEMTEGTQINPAIEDAIKNSYVHIVILSPDFENSKWCLEEVFQIMDTQSSGGTSRRPRKVIPIYCDVERSTVRERAGRLSYNVNRSSPEDQKRWGEAVKGLCNINGFEYNSNVTLQWEKLSEIVVEVEDFLKGVDSRSSILPEQGHQRRSPAQDYEVFLCYIGSDTKHNMVSVLRGMLHWEGITCFNDYDMNDESTEIKPHIEDAIQKSKVYVIFLSPNFASSKLCLEEVYQIMKTRNSPGTSNTVRSVIPVFYDVTPSDVRYQKSSYDLCRVSESTAHEMECWSKSLSDLSLLKGFEFESKTMYQWEGLEKIVKAVKTCLKEPISKNLYGMQLDEVQKVLKSKVSEDVFLIGIHGPNKSQFVEVLEERISTEFDRISTLRNVIEKVREKNGLSRVMGKLFSDLIRISDEEPPKNYELSHGRRYKQILRTKKCLVVLPDVENEIHQMRQLVERLKDILSNSSLVVLSSDFKHMLMEVVKVDKLIELPPLQDSKGTLIICYSNRFQVHEAYLDHLRETFWFYGLDVHLLSVEEVLSDTVSVRNAKVILCISSNTSSTEDFEKICSDPAFHSAEIIMYGPQGMNKITSKSCFKVQVNSENSEFNKTEFKTMVNKVVEMFRKGDEKRNQAVTEFPVGLEQRVDEIKSRILEMHRSGTSLQCFGMWGMGGAGKTTIAKSIYNGIHMHFEKSCFCLNTRANFEKGVVDVQRKIIRGLLGKHDRGTEINDEETGETVLECELKGINALIVLDDVDSEKQLDALYRPICSSLGRKSVIIMTSRDCRVLESVQPNDIFKIKGFENREHSERLFYWHAFLKPEPPAHLLQVSSRIIDACQGLPLSLKVMGAHLYGRNDEPYWDESLLWLQQNETDIFKMLRISYNGLETKQKEAFLDICCFLIGEEEGTACSVLEGCYGLGRTYLEVLKNRCLITISDWAYHGMERIIDVHDHIRDMGRCIVQEEKRDRAWDEVTAENILKDKKARSTLRGLSISSDFSFPKEATKCRSLPHLKILVVEQVDDRERDEGMFHTKNFLEKVRCEELRWLKWRNAPFRDVPVGICPKSLRVLDLERSQIERVPIDSLPNLQRLDLFYCHKLQPFDSSIGKLKDLRYLNLEGCYHVKLLTEEIEGLQSLELLMSNHRPSVFGTSLRTLTSLATTLRTLNLWGCESLESLKPSSSPPNLRHLGLWMCDKLKEVDCEGLQSLELLHLRGCKSLHTLTSLATTLRTLQLSGCESLESLEFSSSLPNLRNLTLWECGKLKELDCEGLQSLELLNLRDCKSLRTLTSLATTLRELYLWGCESLESLKFSSSLPNLRDLTLWECGKLKELDCEGLQSLEFLTLNCESLRTLTSLATTLRTLALYDLKNLESLKAFSFSLPNLQRLILHGCDNLKELDCEGCRSLERLELIWCPKLESLEMPLPPNLRHLRLYGCDGLKEVDCGDLPSLQTLSVGLCGSLKRISVLPRSLERLRVRFCDELQVLDGLDTLTNLSGVRIEGCRHIAEESLPENIRIHLFISGLPRLPDDWSSEEE